MAFEAGEAMTRWAGFVEFEKTSDGNLKITLLPGKREELEEWEDKSTSRATYDLLEHQLCNGWDTIRPEEVGALTEAFIISDDTARDDQGKLVECGRVYSNIDYYQIESDVERLLRLGELIWRGVE